MLEAIDGDKPDQIWCLGDLVGYGPRPNECCRAVAERADVSLCGNHDLGVLGTIDLEDFSSDAAVSARWTRESLEAEPRAFLESLEPSSVLPGNTAELYHGSPRDPVWEYILSAEAAASALAVTEAPLILVGHSHVALSVQVDGEALDGRLAPDGTESDLSSGRWLLNPGSVGQPRDGDPRAAYVLLDLETRFAHFRRVAYPVADTQRELRERGLPEGLAARLERGL